MTLHFYKRQLAGTVIIVKLICTSTMKVFICVYMVNGHKTFRKVYAVRKI